MSQQLTSMSQRIWFELATKHPQKIRERQELVALMKEYENLQIKIQKQIAAIDSAIKKEEDEKDVKPKI
jgi:hypothetical protein